MQLLLVVPRAGRAGVLGAEIQHIPRAQGKYHSYYHIEYHVHLFDSFIIILGFSLFLHCLIITMFFIYRVIIFLTGPRSGLSCCCSLHVPYHIRHDFPILSLAGLHFPVLRQCCTLIIQSAKTTRISPVSPYLDASWQHSGHSGNQKYNGWASFYLLVTVMPSFWMMSDMVIHCQMRTEVYYTHALPFKGGDERRHRNAGWPKQRLRIWWTPGRFFQGFTQF